MSRPTMIFITPHPAGRAGLPSRPGRLLEAFVVSGAFDEVIVVNRLRPADFVRGVPAGRLVVRGGLVGTSRRLSNGAILAEHPGPFGRLEGRFLRGLLSTSGRSPGRVVAWVADPKSVAGIVGKDDQPRPWRVVVDAYDAWDRSPLVRGDRRRRAVAAGYQAAVRADVVFANTIAMRDRLADLGARDVRHLPNACPSVDPVARDSVRRTGLVYVGRIHERFDVGLTLAVATSLPETTVTIAGPVERTPAGWSALAALPNVRLPGRMDPAAARTLLAGAAALIVPHRADDYTTSQDVMKAWDAVACGTPVISTAIPPADGWPPGLAEVCRTDESFVAAARRAVDGEFEAGCAMRLAFAAENQWSARAAVAIAAIAELRDSDQGPPA